MSVDLDKPPNPPTSTLETTQRLSNDNFKTHTSRLPCIRNKCRVSKASNSTSRTTKSNFLFIKIEKSGEYGWLR